MHRFKRNVLDADGRIEGWNNTELTTATGSQLADADLFLPSVPPMVTASGRGFYGNRNLARPAFNDQTKPAAAPAALSETIYVTCPINSGKSRPPQTARAATGPQYPTPTAPTRIATNAPATEIVAPAEIEPASSTFDQSLAGYLRRIIFGPYLLGLLLFPLRLAYLAWRRWPRQKEQRIDGF